MRMRTLLVIFIAAIAPAGPPPRRYSRSAPRMVRTPPCSTPPTHRTRRLACGTSHRVAVEEGITHGAKIGNRAVNRFLRPTH